jgi:hypothetical protein
MEICGGKGKKVGSKVNFFPKMGNFPFWCDHFLQEWGKISNQLT